VLADRAPDAFGGGGHRHVGDAERGNALPPIIMLRGA
jgi:hypothetical protein